MHKISGTAFLLGVILSAWPQPVAAAPQTFNTALPVAQGEFVFRAQYFYRHGADGNNSILRKRNIRGVVSVLGYGLTGDLAVFAVAPYLFKRVRALSPTGAAVNRKTNGPGDARLFGRYTLFQADKPGQSFRLAPFGGIEAPTGRHRDRDRLGRLPAPLQAGSGSWDPFGGIVATYQTLDFEIDASLSYKVNTRAHGFEFGDQFRADASLQYRLLPRELSDDTSGFLYGVIEANLLVQDRNKMAGVKVPASGGTTLFLAPGLQYVTRRWIVETIVQLPVFQDLHGSVLKDDMILRSGFRVNF